MSKDASGRPKHVQVKKRERQLQNILLFRADAWKLIFRVHGHPLDHLHILKRNLVEWNLSTVTSWKVPRNPPLCSYVVNYTLWLPNLVRRTADARYKDDDDLHGGQRSTEVKYSKLCYTATKLALGQKNRWCKFRKMMTFMEVKGQQGSRMVNYAKLLPNLALRTTDASLRWWWTSWRSKVNRGQIQ